MSRKAPRKSKPTIYEIYYRCRSPPRHGTRAVAAAIAGPYANVENNASFVGDEFGLAVTEVHVGYEFENGGLYLQADPPSSPVMVKRVLLSTPVRLVCPTELSEDRGSLW